MAKEKLNENTDAVNERENGRAIILCVLKILEKYSDADHPLTRDAIADKLVEDFGIQKIPTRNTISNNIKLLKEKFNYDIVEGKYGGVYLVGNTFDDLELKMLASSIATAKFLPAKHAKELLGKLNELCSEHNNLIKGVGLVEKYIRTSNRDLSYNLQIIYDAIKENKQIKFVYNDLGVKGELVPRYQVKATDGKYTFNPYEVICNDGNFYVVGSTYEYKNLRHYRLDRITDIEILENSKRIPLREIEGYTDKGYFELTSYVRDHLNMFNGDVKRVKFKASKSILNYIWDTFGDAAEIRELADDKDNVIFTVRTVMDGAKVFAKQFCIACEVLEPQALRDELKQEFAQVAAKYQ